MPVLVATSQVSNLPLLTMPTCEASALYNSHQVKVNLATVDVLFNSYPLAFSRLGLKGAHPLSVSTLAFSKGKSLGFVEPLGNYSLK